MIPVNPPVRVALVIPVLNEEDSIAKVIEEVPRSSVDRIIVADGGSCDRTEERARLAGAEVLNAGRGYGRACFAGALLLPQADIIVFMDGDGADDPAAIPHLVAPILAGEKDFVIGSRTVLASSRKTLAWHQRWAGLVIGWMIGVLYGTRYTDMCAFRAIRREALSRLGMRETSYGWNLEMQLRAARYGLRILEIPVSNRPRIGGESKVAGSWRGSIKAGTRILLTFVRLSLSASPSRGAHTDREPEYRLEN